MLYIVVIMNKPTEDKKISPETLERLPLWGAVAVGGALISRRWLEHNTDADAIVRAIVSVIPIVFWFIWARFALLRIKVMDEMQQVITYKAWFFAGITTMFVMMALRQFQIAKLNLPEWLTSNMNGDGVFLLMAVLVILSYFRFNRQYQ